MCECVRPGGQAKPIGMLKKSMFHIFYVLVRNWNALSDVPFRTIFWSRKSRFWSATQGSWRTKLLSHVQMNLTVCECVRRGVSETNCGAFEKMIRTTEFIGHRSQKGEAKELREGISQQGALRCSCSKQE